MMILNTKFDKDDLKIITALMIFVIIFGGYTYGFFHGFLSIPLRYLKDDATDMLCRLKMISEFGPGFEGFRIGAPFKFYPLDFPSLLVNAIDFVFVKIFSIFIKDVGLLMNIFTLFCQMLICFNSYIILRCMKSKRIFSATFALVYAFSSFFYAKKLGHMSLATYYFVPFSIYLSYFIYNYDDMVDKFQLLDKKNIILYIFCILIGLNVVPYYPFFTCFILMLAIIIKFINNGYRMSSIKPGIIFIILISITVAILLTPYFINIIRDGKTDVMARGGSEMERAAFKPAQLFISPNHHGIEFYKKMIKLYFEKSISVNENSNAYQGIVACIGLLFSFFVILKSGIGKLILGINKFFAKISIFIIMCLCMGGFITLVFMPLKINILRSLNRVSIFLMFISLATLSIFLSNYLDNVKVSKNKVIAICALTLLVAFADQIPYIIFNYNLYEPTKIAWQSDKEFVEKIESVMDNGDMIYQFPYQQYPEAGLKGNMGDYDLMAGYIFSKNLKWSYGALKGREGDNWNIRINRMPFPEMMVEIKNKDFKGIYINKDAYTEDGFLALNNNLKDFVDAKSLLTSSRGNLYFYKLK